jgi:hypothetical protein
MRRALHAFRAAITAAALLAGGCFAPCPALAGQGVEHSIVASMVLQQGLNGYAGVTDATMSKQQPTVNFGSGDTLKVSGSAWSGYHAGEHRSLLKFDIPAALHDSTVVVDAQLWVFQCLGNTLNAALLDTMDVRRVGLPWSEGTGGNGAGAVQSGKVCWNNYGDGAWNTAGAGRQAYTGNAILASGQWGSWNYAAAAGDSGMVPVVCGTDSMFNGLGGDYSFPFDTARDPSGQTCLKVGTGQNNRQGWVCINVQPQVRRWQIGANEDDGFLLALHNNTSNRLFGFYSSNFGTNDWQKAHRPKLLLRVITPSSGATTAVSSSARGGFTRVPVGGR